MLVYIMHVVQEHAIFKNPHIIILINISTQILRAKCFKILHHIYISAKKTPPGV